MGEEEYAVCFGTDYGGAKEHFKTLEEAMD